MKLFHHPYVLMTCLALLGAGTLEHFNHHCSPTPTQHCYLVK